VLKKFKELAEYYLSHNNFQNETYDDISKQINFDELLSELQLSSDVEEVNFLPMNRLNSSAENTEVLDAITRVQIEGRYTTGAYTDEFENLLNVIYPGKWSVGTNSGTTALQISLLAANVQPGDEVILPVNSFAATENAILSIGGVPKYIDIDSSLNINPKLIEQNLSQRTKAIIGVCMYGSSVNLSETCEIAKNNSISCIIDAAQAFGVTRAFDGADYIALSFNPYKNLGAIGKAGAVVTQTLENHRALSEIVYHGFDTKRKNYKVRSWGLNGKIDNLQSAVLLAKYKFWHKNSLKRWILAMRYIQKFQEFGLTKYLTVPFHDNTHTWHLFTILLKECNRDVIRRDLKKLGLETDIYYPILSHQQTPYKSAGIEMDAFPNAISTNKCMLNLPLHNHFTFNEQDKVIRTLAKCFNDNRSSTLG
jgi:3-dehydro-glucose-6-phosphate--glutamate transaminase